MLSDETYLVLGGAGMIGAQVVRHIARQLAPRRVVVASLDERDVHDAVEQFQREFPRVHFVGFAGDVFLRAEWTSPDGDRRVSRTELMESPDRRAEIYDDLFGDADAAYERSQLVRLILEHRPDVVVDGINTATAISYQDVYTSSAVIKSGGLTERAVDELLISQSVPQLIRHATLVHRAMSEAGTRLYLKVGTTGTGGMGLNVPYTHSEDKPSVKLMSKTAIAFAHTGLLFLMARTRGGPVVKEVKPGAMVGYSDITQRAVKERGKPVSVYETKTQPLGDTLTITNFNGMGEIKDTNAPGPDRMFYRALAH